MRGLPSGQSRHSWRRSSDCRPHRAERKRGEKPAGVLSGLLCHITIGGVEHKLILTTKATKDITKRYGGLEKLGDKLLKNATMEESLGEVIWLIALLANQEILIHNLQHRDEPKPLLTEDEIELLTNPYELAEYCTPS